MTGLLMGDQTITLVKHNKTDTDDVYTCYTMQNASWFSSTSIVTSEDGAKPANTYTVRILGKDVSSDITPDLGDYIVRGNIASVTRAADLKEYEHFRITAVGCNLRGLLPHWRVSGS